MSVASEVVDGEVSRDAVEPAPERALAGIRAPCMNGFGDSVEDVLSDFGGVGVLKTSLAGHGEDQRLVGLDELRPRVSVFFVV